jgi:hypothetical protein
MLNLRCSVAEWAVQNAQQCSAIFNTEVLTPLCSVANWGAGGGGWSPPLYKLQSLNRTPLLSQSYEKGYRCYGPWCPKDFLFKNISPISLHLCVKLNGFLGGRQVPDSLKMPWHSMGEPPSKRRARRRASWRVDQPQTPRISQGTPQIAPYPSYAAILSLSRTLLSWLFSCFSKNSFDIWLMLWMRTFLYSLFHLSHSKQQSWHVWSCCTMHITCNVTRARPFLLPCPINSLLCSNSA